MQALWNNFGQVAVVAAFIALIGVALKAATDWLTTSRSKYVEVIAAERIKWVGQLREDFREFGLQLDEVSYQFRQKPLNTKAANEALEGASRHVNVIYLKLNLEDTLDSRVLGLMNRTVFLARTGDLEDYALFKSVMVRFASYLLKDEWEKAKREAAGPLRWLWLWLKQVRRRRERAEFAKTEKMKSILNLAATPLSAEQREIVRAQGNDSAAEEPVKK